MQLCRLLYDITHCLTKTKLGTASVLGNRSRTRYLENCCARQDRASHVFTCSVAGKTTLSFNLIIVRKTFATCRVNGHEILFPRELRSPCIKCVSTLSCTHQPSSFTSSLDVFASADLTHQHLCLQTLDRCRWNCNSFIQSSKRFWVQNTFYFPLHIMGTSSFGKLQNIVHTDFAFIWQRPHRHSHPPVFQIALVIAVLFLNVSASLPFPRRFLSGLSELVRATVTCKNGPIEREFCCCWCSNSGSASSCRIRQSAPSVLPARILLLPKLTSSCSSLSLLLGTNSFVRLSSCTHSFSSCSSPTATNVITLREIDSLCLTCQRVATPRFLCNVDSITELFIFCATIRLCLPWSAVNIFGFT